MPAVFPASAAAAGIAFATSALSVAGAAARPAAFGLHRHSVWLVAGALFPAVAAVFAGLSLAA